MAIRALIFDFDGLILDTETPDYQLLAAQYRDHGVELLVSRWAAGLGTHGAFDPYADLERAIGRAIDREELARDRRSQYLDVVARQPLQAGVLQLLDAAEERAMPRAVASSSERAWVERWTVQHMIRQRFQCMVTRDDVAQVKPAPDLFLAAAACLGVAPAECLVLEDSPNGMRAAHAAGMACVAVPIPAMAGAELPPHTLRLASLADLPLVELLAAVEAKLRAIATA
jgi:HAD superfamily hydrolase (TIGR01509 family)